MRYDRDEVLPRSIHSVCKVVGPVDGLLDVALLNWSGSYLTSPRV